MTEWGQVGANPWRTLWSREKAPSILFGEENSCGEGKGPGQNGESARPRKDSEGGVRGQSDGDWRATGGHRAKVGLGQPEPVGGDCHLR